MIMKIDGGKFLVTSHIIGFYTSKVSDNKTIVYLQANLGVPTQVTLDMNEQQAIDYITRIISNEDSIKESKRKTTTKPSGKQTKGKV